MWTGVLHTQLHPFIPPQIITSLHTMASVVFTAIFSTVGAPLTFMQIAAVCAGTDVPDPNAIVPSQPINVPTEYVQYAIDIFSCKE